ncbi:hypothetical protein LAT59_04075 [Candidatus Gracilibacteria bacterium]|nr:hypothetical protein [Candidatus Gracilibacteria bacterium]
MPSFDNTTVQVEIFPDLIDVNRDKLLAIVDDNDKLPGAGLMLELMVKLLGEKYGIEVELVNESVTIQDEIAQWKNNRLKVDVRKRGTIGSMFLLSHVFGHLIQFSSNADYESILSVVRGRTPPMNLSSEFKSQYFDFENEAFQFGRTIMEEAFDMDESLGVLYSSFAYADYEHYWRHLVRAKGSTKNEFDDVWKNFIKGGIGDTLQAIPLPNFFKKEGNEDLSITVV